MQDIIAEKRRKEYQDAEVKRLAANLKALAYGDLSFEIKVADSDEYTQTARDNFVRINDSLQQVKDVLAALTTETGKLTEAAVEGLWSQRGDVEKFGGEYADIVQGINNTLDAVIEPLKVSADYMNQISQGDFPEKITNNYKGDFNEIKNSINTLIFNLRGTVKIAEKLAAGDMAVEVNILSEKDILGKSLATMVETIKNIV